MKKLFLCVVVTITAAMFSIASARTNAESNVESQAKMSLGQGDEVQYYYLPEIDAYYYVPRKQFIYQSGGHWTFSSALPAMHKDFDLESSNKVVINQAGAYRYNDQHKAQYGLSQKASDKNADRSVSKGKKKLENLHKG